MNQYKDVLEREDPRVSELFNVEADTIDSGSILIEDPFPALNRLREEAPVHKGALGDLMGYEGYHFTNHLEGFPTYSAFTFAAVSKGLIDNKTFSSKAYYHLGTVAGLGESILNKSGADHRMIRGPIQPFFSPAEAQSWWNEKVIVETVETLIAKIEKKSSADLFLELCARMPVHVVSAGFGFDPDDIIPFRIALTQLNRHGIPVEQRAAAMETVRGMLGRLITERRSRPQNDIITKLVTAEVKEPDGSVRGFTDDEIIGNCTLIVLAGGGTTWRQLGITLFALLENPDQMQLFRENRALAPEVILESARWHPTDLIFPRLVEEDAELEGVALPKGAMLHLCLGSANRDPRRWDNPDAFDITRPVQRSLAFGGGPHSCLGQHVSRQEMVVAMDAVFDRLPNVRWDPDKPKGRLIGDLFARGPSALPVVFG
ncbi:cytochrome P450 [Sphingomonas immobilis]|uniref:Cytochrome P450 n=1 Tax=Sphingomonas immobilis TaxID=3063997 RepID=A0ABT8ZX64_9SPHN|nr:cytochrome P450 [Sphingomonas sp. CA1-15]MDO7842141.1 cytochrome P450 [Sphingomonas sp. CA1-15]